MRHHNLPELKKFARTLRKQKPLILNYFHAKKEFSSNIVEAFNNKAKLTIRKSYGFRSDKSRKIAIYQLVADLAEEADKPAGASRSGLIRLSVYSYAPISHVLFCGITVPTISFLMLTPYVLLKRS